MRIHVLLKSALFCVCFTALLVVLSFGKALVPYEYERFTHGIIGTLAALLTTALFLKFDRERFSDIGLTFQRTTIIKFFTGVLIGIGLMGLLATSVIYFTELEVVVNPKSDFLNFFLATLYLIPLAFMEELGFRAYPLETLKNKMSIRLSILITSILFALYHIANGWTVASSFYGPGVWGLIFGLAAIYSKGIALPTGIHYALNLTTSAFGEKNTTASIWTVKQPAAVPGRQGGIDLIVILPSLALLVFAIICIEIFMRRKQA